jgi:hypothetical protein
MLTMPEPSDATGELPGLDQYIRGVYQSKWFPPGVNKNGQVYSTHVNGHKQQELHKYFQGKLADHKIIMRFYSDTT